MNLVRQVQQDCISSTIRVADILRKCKIVAHHLGNKELANWVHKELNGYAAEDALPTYRVLAASARGTFCGPFGRRLENASIPATSLPEDFREWAEEYRCRDNVEVIEELLQSSVPIFARPWPPELYMYVMKNIYVDMQCLAARTDIARSGFVSIIDTVKNRILDFALALDGAFPGFLETPENSVLPAGAQKQVQNIVHQTIHGSVGTLLIGDDNVVTIDHSVARGDWIALERAVKELGGSEDDVAELKRALEQSSERPSLKSNSISSWIGKMTGKAIGGGLRVGGSVLVEKLTGLVAGYLGL